jgi:hypothetical protein
VLEGEPVTEGQFQHLIEERTSQYKNVQARFIHCIKIGAKLDRI